MKNVEFVQLFIATTLLTCTTACGGEPEPAANVQRIPEWQISAAPELMLGGVEFPEAQLFGNLRDAARLSDGSLAVADASTNDIRVFLSDGSHQFTVGRSGRGPGEFRDIWNVLIGAGDTIWGFDQRSWKLVGYHARAFQREIHFDRAWPLKWVGNAVVASLYPIEAAPGRPPGLYRAPLRLVVYGANGVPADTVAYMLDRELYLDSDRNWQTPLLPRNPYVAVGSDFLAVADGAAPPILVLSLSGDTLSRIALPQVSEARRDEIVTLRRAEQLRSAPPENRARVERILGGMPIPDQVADISAIVIDEQDRIWVRPILSPADSLPEWRVYDRSGHAVSRIKVPQRLRIRHIDDQRIVATERGVDDLPLVTVYRVQK